MIALKDSPGSFGSISILLHWISAACIITLWFIGDGIAALDTEGAAERRQLHVLIAVSVYFVLWARIFWRVFSKHPQASGQSRLTHRLASTVHYLMLTAVAGMLCSGPLIAWFSGQAISIFGMFSIYGPATEIPWLMDSAGAVHRICGKAIVWLAVIHVAAALKHLMFHDDETIARMIAPKRMQ